jgi:hypothetical protein
MSNHKKLFLEVLDDLRAKCESKSNYNYVKAAGLLRQLLLDATPLVDVINKEYKEKIVFEVNKPLPEIPKKIIQDGQELTTYYTVSL